jgi:hypothetical protein
MEKLVELTGFEGWLIPKTTRLDGYPQRCLGMTCAEQTFRARARMLFRKAFSGPLLGSAAQLLSRMIRLGSKMVSITG